MSVQSYLDSVQYWPGSGAKKSFSLSDWRQGLAEFPVGSGKNRRFSYPLAFAGLVDEAGQPGGVLSDLYTNRQFSGEVGAIERTNQQRETEGFRGLVQSGVNPTLAASFYAEDPYRSRRDIFTRRSEMEGELQQNRFGAQQGLANVFQQAEHAISQLYQARSNVREGVSAQGRAQAFDLKNNIVDFGTAYLFGGE